MAPPAIRLALPNIDPYASRDSSRHCLGSVNGHTRSYLRGSEVSIFDSVGGWDEDEGEDVIFGGLRVRSNGLDCNGLASPHLPCFPTSRATWSAVPRAVPRAK